MNERREISTTKELAEWYSAKYAAMGDGWHTPAEECNRHLDDLGVPYDKKLRLLDVGCGAGHFLAEASKRVRSIGCDISEVGCHLACRRAPEAMITSITIERWEYWRPLGPFDFIVSIGSLEHIVDLDAALENIRRLLSPTGKFYFYCPNEKWMHFDQPNERTMPDDEWQKLFESHGLITCWRKRWNDSTAFCGTATPYTSASKLNIGSGQRRFDRAHGWINIDCVSRPPDQVPDVVCDVGKEALPYADGTIDCCVLHQVYEHFGLGEGHALIRECHRVLRPGASLIITVPDMKALAQRWLVGTVSNYIYFVNVYGAYQGLDSDRHKWGYSYTSLVQDMKSLEDLRWAKIQRFDWRTIPGADLAQDWWVLALELVK